MMGIVFIYLRFTHSIKLKAIKNTELFQKKSNTLLDNNIYAILHIKYTITKNLK
jgi:hypothetical protein